jgi:rhamnogalacturonan endolyase
MKRPHVPLIFLAMLTGLTACTPPIWNKMQKRAAVVQGLAPMPARNVLVADDFSDWKAHWTEESETPGQIRFLTPDSCLDIVAPKGLTLWYNVPFKGNLSIRYQIRAVSGPEPTDRCSDLNCFWMASDPLHPDSILSRKDFRNGQFGKYYSLRLYYLGYGGNGNTTTRFRRYDGDYEAFQKAQSRPSVQAEYTDKDHLIKPNHWYSVRIDVHDGVVCYWSDNELLVNYRDPSPLTKGWFGFRTTQNHLQIREFSVSKPL